MLITNNGATVRASATMVIVFNTTGQKSYTRYTSGNSGFVRKNYRNHTLMTMVNNLSRKGWKIYLQTEKEGVISSVKMYFPA